MIQAMACRCRAVSWCLISTFAPAAGVRDAAVLGEHVGERGQASRGNADRGHDRLAAQHDRPLWPSAYLLLTHVLSRLALNPMQPRTSRITALLAADRSDSSTDRSR
jgi:hypothetical protein